MLSDSLVGSFRSRLEVLGLELADLRLGRTPQRPLVPVRIEWPPDDASRRVSVADCAAASRLLEAWLDADGPLGRRSVLGGARPGPGRPPRRDPHSGGVRGRGGARVVAVPDAATVVLQREGAAAQPIPLARIRDARLAVDW